MLPKVAMIIYSSIVIFLFLLVKWEYKRARKLRRRNMAVLPEGYSRGSK